MSSRLINMSGCVSFLLLLILLVISPLDAWVYNESSRILSVGKALIWISKRGFADESILEGLTVENHLQFSISTDSERIECNGTSTWNDTVNVSCNGTHQHHDHAWNTLKLQYKSRKNYAYINSILLVVALPAGEGATDDAGDGFDVSHNGVFIAPSHARFIHGIFTTCYIDSLAIEGSYVPSLKQLHGTNYFDRREQMLFVLVRGSRPIDIARVRILRVALVYSTDDVLKYDPMWIGVFVKRLTKSLRLPKDSIRLPKNCQETHIRLNDTHYHFMRYTRSVENAGVSEEWLVRNIHYHVGAFTRSRRSISPTKLDLRVVPSNIKEVYFVRYPFGITFQVTDSTGAPVAKLDDGWNLTVRIIVRPKLGGNLLGFTTEPLSTSGRATFATLAASVVGRPIVIRFMPFNRHYCVALYPFTPPLVIEFIDVLTNTTAIPADFHFHTKMLAMPYLDKIFTAQMKFQPGGNTTIEHPDQAEFPLHNLVGTTMARNFRVKLVLTTVEYGEISAISETFDIDYQPPYDTPLTISSVRRSLHIDMSVVQDGVAIHDKTLMHLMIINHPLFIYNLKVEDLLCDIEDGDSYKQSAKCTFRMGSISESEYKKVIKVHNGKERWVTSCCKIRVDNVHLMSEIHEKHRPKRDLGNSTSNLSSTTLSPNRLPDAWIVAIAINAIIFTLFVALVFYCCYRSRKMRRLREAKLAERRGDPDGRAGGPIQTEKAFSGPTLNTDNRGPVPHTTDTHSPLIVSAGNTHGSNTDAANYAHNIVTPLIEVEKGLLSANLVRSNGRDTVTLREVENYESHINSARGNRLLREGVIGLINESRATNPCVEVNGDNNNNKVLSDEQGRLSTRLSIEDVEDTEEPELQAIVDEEDSGVEVSPTKEPLPTLHSAIQEPTIPVKANTNITSKGSVGPEDEEEYDPDVDFRQRRRDVTSSNDRNYISPVMISGTQNNIENIDRSLSTNVKYLVYLKEDFGREVVGCLSLPGNRSIPLSELRQIIAESTDANLQEISMQAYTFVTETLEEITFQESGVTVEKAFPKRNILIRLKNVKPPLSSPSPHPPPTNFRPLNRSSANSLKSESIRDAVNIRTTLMNGKANHEQILNGGIKIEKYVGPLGVCHRPDCGNAARVKCIECGMVAYCSSRCLRMDSARHRVSCYRPPWRM